MEDIVERMRKEIEVQVVKGDAFRVGFTSSDARTAMRVTERLASLFIEENLRDREVLAEGTNQFLEAQLEDARRRLIENEKRLEDYRSQHSGELPTQLEANIQGQHNIEMQLQALLESVNRDRDRRLALERLLADANTPDRGCRCAASGHDELGRRPDRRDRRRSAPGRAGRAAGAAAASEAGASGHAADGASGRRAPEEGRSRSAGASGIVRPGAVDAGRDRQAEPSRRNQGGIRQGRQADCPEARGREASARDAGRVPEAHRSRAQARLRADGADARLRDLPEELPEPSRQEGGLERFREPRAPADRRAVQDPRSSAHAGAAIEPESTQALWTRRRGRHWSGPGAGNPDRISGQTAQVGVGREGGAQSHGVGDGAHSRRSLGASAAGRWR